MIGAYYLTPQLQKDLGQVTKLYAQLNPDRRNDKSPDWLLYANQAQAGVLWSRESQRGEYFTGQLEVGSKSVRIMIFKDAANQDSWLIHRDTDPKPYKKE